MARNALSERLRLSRAILALSGCLLFTSCQSYGLIPDSDWSDPQEESSQKPGDPFAAFHHTMASPDEGGCSCKHAKSCATPTVEALAQDLDALERHIEKYGSVVAQHPDVWGQARLTKHRQDFEDEMYKELGNFNLTLQGSLARSDQAYAADAFALSSAAAAASSPDSNSSGGGKSSKGGKSSSSTSSLVVTGSDATPAAGGSLYTGTLTDPTGPSLANATTLAKNSISNKTTSTPAKSSGSGTPDNSSANAKSDPSKTSGSDPSGGGKGGGAGGSPDLTGDTTPGGTFGAFGAVTRTATSSVTGPSYSFPGNGAINVEPEVLLNQKARYINHLNELRRINEGDDTADSPGYALNLVRIPVSILPGKCTEIGHGAEVTMTLTPRLSVQLLPTTFRNLIVNDLVEQIAYPVTQFINNPDNSIYLDDRREARQSGDLTGDVANLFRFIDENKRINLFPALNVYGDPKRAEQLEKQADAIKELISLRTKLTLQPVFSRSEWDWVDGLLRDAKDLYDTGNQLQNNLAQALANNPGKTPEQIDINLRTRALSYYNRSAQILQTQLVRFQPVAIVPATKSRRATLPFPPAQMIEVYGYDFVYQVTVEAYRGLRKEHFTRPCLNDDKFYIHLPDVQGYLQEELAAAYKLLALPCNFELWQTYCTEELASAIRAHQAGRIREQRESFAAVLSAKAQAGAPPGAAPPLRAATIALAWATIVESALLNEQLVQDMKESAAAKGCPCPHEGWLPYFLPDPPPEARQAFNDYVRCRWPIHVFALDPVTQEQNISDTFSGRREMQLSMSLAFVGGKISASNLMRYARRIEYDMATISLNGTQVGFSHGDDTFGWRFYPRYQTADIESNTKVFFRDLLWGGPSKNALLRQRRLEPGERECVAVVIMPSFVPYADLNVTSNWFALTNPKRKTMDTEFAMRLSKSVKCIENCGPNVYDAGCYRDGDLDRLRYKAKQLAERLPLQSTTVQIPYENTLGGFGMFNTGVTDLAPELNGWYGAPSINPNAPTTIFLVGNHFSVHQTSVIAGGNEIITKEMLSRQVMKVVVPPTPILLGDATQKFVDIHLATPYGVSQHLLVPVCTAPCPQSCGQAAGMTQGAATANTPPPPTVVSPTSSAVVVPMPAAAATQTPAPAGGAQTPSASDPSGATWKGQSGGGASGKKASAADGQGNPGS